MVYSTPDTNMSHRTSTEHALIYATRTAFNRQSAIIFTATGYALAPVSVLLHCIPVKTAKRLSNALLSNQIVDVYARDSSTLNDLWAELRHLTLRLVHRPYRTLCTTDARIAYVFNCRNISESVSNLLDGFEPPKKRTDSDFGIGLSAMSAFIVLHIGGHVQDDAAARSILRRKFQEAVRHEKDRSCIRFQTVQRLDPVASVTTPFGNETFFGALNKGSIANVFGRNDCLFVVSQPLAAGCDGGIVYNKRLELIGVIICTTFQWNGTENASMTLVANFAEIVEEFLQQSSLCDNLHVERMLPNSELAKTRLEKSVLLLEVGGSSGSGCFVRVNGERFILTCAHVVANAKTISTAVHCTWHGGSFTTRILYRNVHFDRAYDVALLHAPDNQTVPDATFTTFASTKASPGVGYTVFAAGFPHFFALAKRQFAPSLMEGRVIKVLGEHMICTDASVQAGQSGGPLLDANGRVVGVLVSNARDSINGRIYPNVNMCVPSGVIEAAIIEYTQNKDIRQLDHRMQASEEVARCWNLLPVLVPSKL